MPRGTELIKSVIEQLSKSTGFGRCMKGVRVLSAGDGKCTAEFTVADEHLNEGGSLHGGFTATLIDCISTYALLTHKVGVPGLSVDLHITYMKTAFPGEVVTVDAKTVRAGCRLAFLTVDLTKDSGKIPIAHGLHTKYL